MIYRNVRLKAFANNPHAARDVRLRSSGGTPPSGPIPLARSRLISFIRLSRILSVVPRMASIRFTGVPNAKRKNPQPKPRPMPHPPP